MDPAIMKKLLEEDEDENMHSGAEVEAFTAALNRDIEGDTSKLQLSISGRVLPLAGSQSDSQIFQRWQSSGVKKKNSSGEYEAEAIHHLNSSHSSEGKSNPENVDHEQHGTEFSHHRPERNLPWDEHGHHQGETAIAFPSSQPQAEQTSSRAEEKHVSPPGHNNNQNPGGEFHPPRAQRMNIQPALEHTGSGKRVPFASLLPVITPQLEKDKAMQLQTLYQKLKRNEIPKDGFVRHMKTIVGDHILRVAVMQMHAHMPRQVLAQQKQQAQMPTRGPPKLQHELTNSSSAEPFENSYPLTESGNGAKQLLEMERQQQAGSKMDGPPSNGGVNQESFHPSQQLQGLSRQHPPQPSSSYLMYRPNNSANLFKTDVDNPLTDCGIRQHGVPSQPQACSYQQQQQPIAEASNVNEPPVTVAGATPKVIPKKASSVGQKRALEATPASPPQQGHSKKQRAAVAGLAPDQSIDQLNDVTAVSGVNLREEEEHMFSEAATKAECGGIHEASRRVVQEEEEQLLLQRIPLQKKLEKIMARCGGLTNVGNDVERCLSLCVEERLRGLITCLIRSSRQRASSDAEKTRHRVVVTSDVRQQIFLMNQRIRDEQQQAAAPCDETSQRENEAREGFDVGGGNGGKEKARSRLLKQQQQQPVREEDERTRASAANVAARAAAGGDDMLSKWQLMAEQARQKRDDASGRNLHPQHAHDGGEPPQHQHQQRQQRRQRSSTTTVSIRDVIAVLEREPHMAKSTLMYRLYDKTHTP